ncbi:MAG: PilZ domain-containing protein [Sandaracinus sp.]|jgi:c-di-GMP-binding flagellar brake protein YcgR|nr:PilZ domain-containing protein [Sandaracinus sp.]MCB9623024.1 PilZ domain-containing protein [Sandaracinus sp.]
MSDEQRKHQRFDVEVAGELALDGDVVGASTQNLSAGGVALLMDREIADGQSLDVTLFLTQDGIEDPDQEPFEAKAVVRWVADREDGLFLVGLQFDAIDGAAAKRLQHFLRTIG